MVCILHNSCQLTQVLPLISAHAVPWLLAEMPTASVQGAQLEPQMGSGGYLVMMTQLLALSQGWMVSAALCAFKQLSPTQLPASAVAVPHCTWSPAGCSSLRLWSSEGQPPAGLPS